MRKKNELTTRRRAWPAKRLDVECRQSQLRRLCDHLVFTPSRRSEDKCKLIIYSSTTFQRKHRPQTALLLSVLCHIEKEIVPKPMTSRVQTVLSSSCIVPCQKKAPSLLNKALSQRAASVLTKKKLLAIEMFLSCSLTFFGGIPGVLDCKGGLELRCSAIDPNAWARRSVGRTSFSATYGDTRASRTQA